MWKLFGGSQSKERPIEERLKSSFGRIFVFVTKCIESCWEGRSGPAVTAAEIEEPVADLLAWLIAEDGKEQDGCSFGEGMMWTLQSGLYDQMVAWAQLDQPPGLFAKVLSFFTYLVIDIRNQPLLRHSGFNRALTSLVIFTNERLQRGQVFLEARETAIPLVHALCCRLQSDPLLANCFFIADNTPASRFILVPIVDYFLRTEKRENVSAMECVEMMGELEDSEVAEYMVKESCLMRTMALRLTSYVSNLPREAGKGTKLQRSGELEETCRYVRGLDSFCKRCLHPALVQQLSHSLLEDCLRPYFAHFLHSPDGQIRLQFTLYLLEIARQIQSKELLLTITHMLRGPIEPISRHRFESFSTHSSSPAAYQNLASTQGSVWEGFLENLGSPNLPLRLASLRVVEELIGRKEWEVVDSLVLATLQSGEMDVITCSYEQFMSNFPGSLLHSDLKSAYLYYYEGLNEVLNSSLPPFQPPKDSFITKKDHAHHRNMGTEMVLSDLLYGEEKGGCGVERDFGPVLKLLIGKLEGLFSNGIEENLLITGIFAHLCRFPPFDPSSTALYSCLFNPSDPNSMFSVLKRVFPSQLDDRVLAMARDTLNFEGALYGARLALGLHVDPAVHAARDYSELHLRQSGREAKKVRDARFIEVRTRQGVVLYQEFARELAGCALVQEQMSVLRDTAYTL